MIRRFVLGSLVTIGLTASAVASDIENLDQAERDAFRAEVRAYLLENPEVLMEAIGILEQRQQDNQVNADRNLVAAHSSDLFEDPTSWVGGNPDGDVTIVEFIDYRCSFCRRAHPEIAQLLDSDDNIRMIIKEYPILGEESVLASRFAIATRMVEGDDAYKLVGDSLIGVRGRMSHSTFQRIADEFDLDAEAIFAAMGSSEVETIIQRNHRLARNLQITGTPSFVFGSDMVRGYVPLHDMQRIVQAIRRDS